MANTYVYLIGGSLDSLDLTDRKQIVNYLLPKESRLRASSTQVGSLSYEQPQGLVLPSPHA